MTGEVQEVKLIDQRFFFASRLDEAFEVLFHRPIIWTCLKIVKKIGIDWSLRLIGAASHHQHFFGVINQFGVSLTINQAKESKDKRNVEC